MSLTLAAATRLAPVLEMALAPDPGQVWEPVPVLGQEPAWALARAQVLETALHRLI